MNVVHIGLQRTGNTTLQNALFSEHDRFFYIGKKNDLYPDDSIRELINCVAFQDSLSYDPAHTQTLLKTICAANSQGKPLLVSDEIFSIEGRADRRLVADRLHRLFAPAKVFIALRAQTTIVQALYMKHLSALGLRTVSFESWLESKYSGVRYGGVYRIDLDYDALVRTYEDIFGAENIIVLPSELMHEEQSLYQVQLAELLGMPAQAVQDALNLNAADQRVSHRHALAHRIQDVLLMEANLAEIGRRFLPRAIYQFIRRFVAGGRRIEVPDLPERWRQRIGELCAEGNSNIERRRKLPLQRLGYPVSGSA